MPVAAVEPAQEFITTMPADTKARVRSIKRVILEEEQKARQQYPFLYHQDILGMAFFLFGLGTTVASSYAYLTGMLAWYFTIPITAFAVSILHELEHDLIHNQYYKGQKWMQSLMFSFIWLFKFHANPWWRRDIHHWHHRVSGQYNDIEERFLGLGMQMNWRRLGMTLHPLGMINEIPQIKREAGDALDLVYLNRSSLILATIAHSFIKATPWLLLASYLTGAEQGSTLYGVTDFVTKFMVIVIYPMVVRQGCLMAMSTACHYYGDIPEHNVYFQNQIIDHWLLWPFQMFCWGFASTHIIHHYVPNQPFYLRSIIKGPVHKEMVAQGVRLNDWGVMLRANKWHITAEQQSKGGRSAALWFISLIAFGSFTVHLWDLVMTPRLLFVMYRFVVVYSFNWLLGRNQKSKKIAEHED